MWSLSHLLWKTRKHHSEGSQIDSSNFSSVTSETMLYQNVKKTFFILPREAAESSSCRSFRKQARQRSYVDSLVVPNNSIKGRWPCSIFTLHSKLLLQQTPISSPWKNPRLQHKTNKRRTFWHQQQTPTFDLLKDIKLSSQKQREGLRTIMPQNHRAGCLLASYMPTSLRAA